MSGARSAAFAAVAFALAGCRGEPSQARLPPVADSASVAPSAPVTEPATAADADAAMALDEPAAQFPDATALWRAAIVRTCGPNAGVCHNDKQFPDLQSVAGFLATPNQPCNSIREDPSTVDNLCEPPGDALVLGTTFRTRIGHVAAHPETGTLVVTLHDRVPPEAAEPMTIERTTPGLSPIVLPLPPGAIVSVSADPPALVLRAEALKHGPDDLAAFLAPPGSKPGSRDHVALGDPNGDGVFGADLGGALVKPGDPMKSYLFLRVLGPLALGPAQRLTNERAAQAEEPQMPIANFQYWDQDHALVALWCWIEGLKADGANAAAPIDYAHCGTSKIPRAAAQEEREASFAYVYARILQPKCIGPCHVQGADAVTDLRMDSDPQKTWALLVGTMPHAGSARESSLPLVARGDPARSYLLTKVTAARPPKGERMPPKEPLPKEDIAVLERWIRQGANAY